ncbi:hypothetical protein BFP97_12290 [Roseivirga sp. 4D4]|uniref:hypothetical protein n=1 Tax=Roseivirga sp. 4D4 TaxID=1889784 RepID=UPI000852E50B|nr:hypothetical protein [Roseivirga sp. 4D4]OEK02248.1 hypothetical protein BFP97_12290 [Roseivirga sp. 4D4]
MKKHLTMAILLTVAFGCEQPNSSSISYPASEVFHHDWAMNKIWEDGQAEVAHYDAEMIVYGKVRKFDNAYITVKEEFNKDFNVKTDDYQRDDLFSVMKVNKFGRFETENYPYHYLTSLFFKREKPEQLHKMTHTGQEWCGNTFKQFELTASGYEYDYNSYFDGYGDGRMAIEGTDLIWEDQLSYLLRATKFKDGLEFTKQVVDSQINTKTRKPKIYDASFRVSDRDSVWHVELALEQDKVNTYTFNKKYPNLLQEQTTWYGYNLKLNRVSRYQYWR